MPGFAPKLRVLTPTESQSSLDVWRETLLFHLTLDGSFEDFLEEGYTWESIKVNNRGLKADPETKAHPRTAKQKAQLLKLMLGTIASYAPVISREFIVSEALSLNAIWHRLRIHYGFRKSGALILDLTSIHREEGESYEALWERYHSFVTDNLLQPTDNILHRGVQPTETEEISPTLLNIMVTLWLHTINSSLPALVKQKYTTELRIQTLASLREEISESIDSLLGQVDTEGACIARAFYSKSSQHKENYSRPSKSPMYNKPRSTKVCPLCEATGRRSDHFLSECKYLPETDRKYMSSRAKSRAVEGFKVLEDSEDEDYDEESCASGIKQININDKSQEPCNCLQKDHINKNDLPTKTITSNISRVDVVSSPCLWVKYGKHNVNLTLDTAAEADVMKLEFARKIGAPICNTTVGAVNADGKTDLKTVGEVHLSFTWQNLKLRFDGLVVEDLSDDVLAGAPFMTVNDVYARPAHKKVFIGEIEVPYKVRVRAKKAMIMRVPRQRVLLPGDKLKLSTPDSLLEEKELAVEPRTDAKSMCSKSYSSQWLQPTIVPQLEGQIELLNTSTEPILIRRHEQIAMIRPVDTKQENIPIPLHDPPPTSQPHSSESKDYLDITINNNILTKKLVDKAQDLHECYKDVFDTRTIGCYNGASGPLEVKINIGPDLPPHRKGRMPLYNRALKEEYQKICDELEGTVLLKPENEGIVCEYLNPSFLITKKSGKKRLVTAFTEIAQYTKPQPTLMSNIDETLRLIATWDYIILSDATSAYWQMKIEKASMKYTGIVTPYKGIRVYGRGAMGMPGTETALEELMYRVLGEQLAAGGVAKVMDDLYCGGSTPEEALYQWEQVLKSFSKNGLRLSPTKTVICPQSTTILGWVWSQGTIKASPHRISALAAVDPANLTTVGQLRSFIGSYKFLSRVLKSYSDYISPLEDVIAGKKKSERIEWSQSLLEDFKKAQSHLSKNEILTMPRKTDQLKIICDASKIGIGAALYIIRNGKEYLAGNYSAKLKKHQVSWLPCETESLSITAAVNHFAPDIVNSDHQTLVLTDSLPSVQAYNKLKKGQFSASARVSTFLSTVSRYNIYIAHLKGSENTYSDYVSRNPVECHQKQCQICSFIQETSDSVIRTCTVKDILDSNSTVPFSSRSGWYELQMSDDSLRRTCAHLKQGTSPSRKCTKIGDVKKYLQHARISKDGLLVVPSHVQSIGKIEKIIVPRDYLHGLLESLHIKLNHPSKLQLQKVFQRAYFALNFDKALDEVSRKCHTCVSLSNLPNKFMKQSITTLPTAIGSNFSADVVKRSNQHILFIREYVSSYSQARLIPNEQAKTIKEALIIMCHELISKNGPKATVKVDPASACRSLVGNQELQQNGIVLELGHPKFKNKIPVSDRGIRELHSELNRIMQHPPITPKLLSSAVSTLNSRLRRDGLSSWEMWTHRCQFTGSQLPINDLLLIKRQEGNKLKSHTSSAKHKARGKTSSTVCPLKRGQLVYLYSDRNKHQARERYIVKDVLTNTCSVQKFAGSQLRARTYTVNRADISIVPSWKFSDDEQLSDEDDDADHAKSYYTRNDESSDEVEDSGDEVFDEEENDPNVDPEVMPNQQREIRTRSGRSVRTPSRFGDYIM